MITIIVNISLWWYLIGHATWFFRRQQECKSIKCEFLSRGPMVIIPFAIVLVPVLFALLAYDISNYWKERGIVNDGTDPFANTIVTWSNYIKHK